MSLGVCIPDLLAAGKITKGQADAAQTAYERHYRRLVQHMAPEGAAAEASERALSEMTHGADLAKRQKLLAVKAQQRILADIESLVAKGDDRYEAASKVLAAGNGANVLNVDAQHKVIRGRAQAVLVDLLRKHSRNLAGEARDKSGLRDIVRELFGEDTGNRSAKEFGEAWREASESLRQQFNRAGGDIAKRADWGLPQTHDMMKVRAAGYDAWRAEVAPRLDLSRMIDDSTGQPFTAEGLEDALRDVFESIRTDGWNKRSPGDVRIGKLASRRADHRFLVFKSAEDWMAYQERFGTGNPFDAMMGHIDGVSRDIAMMQAMGPNPNATLRWMKDGLKRHAALDPDTGTRVLDRARSADKRLDDLYKVVSGSINSPVDRTWARRMGGTRAVLTSAFLGSASLSAVTDVAFQGVTRGYNGLPVTGALTGYLKHLNPAKAEDRRIAVRLGLQAEEASRHMAALSRFIDGNQAPEVASRLSDAVLRVSGLSAWTQVGRWEFGMSTLGHLADLRGRTFEQLDTPLRGMLERYGIDAPAWDTVRASETYKHGGSEWIDATKITDQDIGDRLLRMVLTETDYAVPTATARSRATLSFGQEPGTLGGEVIRNGALFKSFGVGMLLTHGARMWHAETGWSRAKYFAGLTITTTLLGALALQLRNIAQGRDAQDMTTTSFWGQAMLQGGGYGIFGDFLKGAQDENRFGGGLAETLAGPVVGAAGDLSRAAGGAIDGHAGRETVKLLRRYMPGGSLWYARTAWNRYVADQLQRQIDPGYYDSIDRLERRADRQGEPYWWRPGETSPDRAPEFAEAPR